jgi:Protein of unknown function (DUF2490)
MKIRILFLLFSVPLLSNAQLGTWNILNMKLEFNDRWSVFGEGQLRSLKFYDDFHYYELKGGVTYMFKNKLAITTGGGTYNTFLEGGNFVKPALNNEFRSWIQLSMKQSFGRTGIEHRYRAEQRWTSNGYRNRFRYRLAATIPLNKREIEKGTLYASLWNEIFFTNRSPYFERNRVFGGFGYELDDNTAIQMGYLYQFDYQLTDETGRDFLQVSLLFSIDTRHQKHHMLPGTID